jgi:hypothetical protein
VLLLQLSRVMQELWLFEYEWKSIEVFARLRLICETMALHGLAFARHEAEWRLVMTDDDEAIPEIQDALARLMTQPGRLTSDS